MSNQLISKKDLLAAGLKSSWIDAVLDAPDEVGPSSHWLNKSGDPLYDRNRLKVACARMGFNPSDLPESYISTWISDQRPTSKPILTFDFHALADVVLPGVSRELRSLHHSHPVLGRAPEALSEEHRLIDSCLKTMIQSRFEIEVGENQVYQFLDDLSISDADRLMGTVASELIVRPARRRSYISKSISPKSITKFLYVMALIQKKIIVGSSGKAWDVRDLLSSASCIRLDSTRLKGVNGSDGVAEKVSDLLSRLLDNGESPHPSRTSSSHSGAPDIEVMSVLGVVKRAVWLRIFHSVYDVITNQGPAYLYPLDSSGSARLVLKTEAAPSMGRMIKVPADLLPLLESYEPKLETLKRDQATPG